MKKKKPINSFNKEYIYIFTSSNNIISKTTTMDATHQLNIAKLQLKIAQLEAARDSGHHVVGAGAGGHHVVGAGAGASKYSPAGGDEGEYHLSKAGAHHGLAARASGGGGKHRLTKAGASGGEGKHRITKAGASGRHDTFSKYTRRPPAYSAADAIGMIENALSSFNLSTGIQVKATPFHKHPSLLVIVTHATGQEDFETCVDAILASFKVLCKVFSAFYILFTKKDTSPPIHTAKDGATFIPVGGGDCFTEYSVTIHTPMGDDGKPAPFLFTKKRAFRQAFILQDELADHFMDPDENDVFEDYDWHSSLSKFGHVWYHLLANIINLHMKVQVSDEAEADEAEADEAEEDESRE